MLILDTLNKTTIWGGTRLQKFGSDPLEPHVGSLYTVAGKGSFVAKKNTALLREEQLKKIEDHLSEVRRLAATISLSREDIRDMLDLMWEDES